MFSNIFKISIKCAIIPLVIKMKFILCLDDNNGMLFNNRRQSRDSVLIEDVIKNCGGERINIFPFSQQLFSGYEDNINIVSAICENGAYFVENVDITPFSDDAEEFIVYRWNRVYPSDFSCNIDFSHFPVKAEAEFKGSSHEKITKIIYGR